MGASSWQHAQQLHRRLALIGEHYHGRRQYLDRLQTEEQLRSESARPDSYVEQFERHEQRVRELEADVVRLEAALAGARAEARQQDVIMSALEARLATVNSSSAITTTSYVALLV